MPRWKRTLRLIAIMAAFLLVLAIFGPANQGTNCGGNTAAITMMHQYKLIASQVASESPGHRFLVTSATPRQIDEFTRIVNNGWTGDARFLVSTLPYTEETRDLRQILMACDRAFTNFPRGRFFRSPPTHAAVFQDGNIRLISVAEFEALDKSTLVPMDTLVGKPRPSIRGTV
jgi:hypothetical protein